MDDEIDEVLHNVNQEENVRVNQEGNVDVNQEINVEDIPLICKSMCRNGLLNKSIQFINRTGTTEIIHQACVCVMCDYFIIRIEPI